MRHPAAFALVLVLLTVTGGSSMAADRPNVVVILADDLGYSDLGCYGGEVRTPNLDALARGGVRFTSFYNGGRCCPTRAALMTGLYPHQAGVGRMTKDEGAPGYRGFLTANTVTIPEVLRAAGYRTGMVGKWHLSLTAEEPGHMRRLNNQQIADRFSEPATYPTARGFDAFYGTIWGVVNFYDPFSLVRGVEPVREVPADYYITDALTHEAVKFVEGGKPDQPFFLYVAHTAPHWPLHAPEADVARYAETYAGGWDAVRQARHQRMVALGLLPADHPLPPQTAKGGSPTEWSANPTRAWDARAMAVHATMIDRMDQGIGRLVAALRERNQLDNTLILFLSVNGASPEVYTRPGFDRPSQTRDGRKIAYPPGKTVMPGPETTFFYMGPDWASVANTPFRYWKAEMYEGGICTPMIAHWPKGVTAKPGSTTDRPGHVIDVMATCLDLAGAEYPKTFDGRAVTPIEGRSLLPALRGEQAGGHEMLAWEHYGGRAIRQGNMKLVARAGQPWELYDLSADRAETRDLATARPEQVKAMDERWKAWADRAQVFPVPPAAGKAKAAAAKRAG